MREESEQDDQPMENPYEQPSRHAGSSQQREEPVDQWEQQLSSPQIPGSCMKQALFVLAMKMAVSSQITMEKRSSLSENGHFCYPLKELL